MDHSKHEISINRTIDSLVRALFLGPEVVVLYERGSGKWAKGAVFTLGDERTLEEVGLERAGRNNGVVWIAAA